MRESLLFKFKCVILYFAPYHFYFEMALLDNDENRKYLVFCACHLLVDISMQTKKQKSEFSRLYCGMIDICTCQTKNHKVFPSTK